MAQSSSDELSPAQQAHLRRAVRRSVVTIALAFALAIVWSFVLSYGVPWHWSDPGAGTPWPSIVLGVVLLVGCAALSPVLVRSRLGVPGPARDLAVSGGVGDVMRVARDLATGHVLDEQSRRIGRALVATLGRRMLLSGVVLVGSLAIVALTVAAPSGAARWAYLTVGVLLALGSLAVMAWSAAVRRHASAQGLDDTGPGAR
ncbi:MAG: hypothetical protein M3Y71_11410 [Actinomycetota bacterium]|nr:hypothetical protein [Actinomycetota bacterium]